METAMKKAYLLLGAVSVASIGLGAAGGYLFAYKRIEKAYDEMLRDQIEEAKKFYSVAKMDSDEKPESPIQALTDAGVVEAAEAFKKYNTNFQKADAKQVVEEVLATPQANNIFARPAPKNTGPERRDPAMPYAITEDEFNQAQNDHEQVSLTYYAGDDTLADETDQVAESTLRTQMVGDHNLALFGDESVDQIWVRCELQKFDFEISRSTGEYAKEVAGFR